MSWSFDQLLIRLPNFRQRNPLKRWKEIRDIYARYAIIFMKMNMKWVSVQLAHGLLQSGQKAYSDKTPGAFLRSAAIDTGKGSMENIRRREGNFMGDTRHLKLVPFAGAGIEKVGEHRDALPRFKGLVLSLTGDGLDCLNRISRQEMEKASPDYAQIDEYFLLHHYLAFIKRLCQKGQIDSIEE